MHDSGTAQQPRACRRVGPPPPAAAAAACPTSAAIARRHSRPIVCDPSPAAGDPLHLPGRQGGGGSSSGRGAGWARAAQACPAQADPQSQVPGEGGSHGPDHQQRRRGQGACKRVAGLECWWLGWCGQGPCLGRHLPCSELLSCLNAVCAASAGCYRSLPCSACPVLPSEEEAAAVGGAHRPGQPHRLAQRDGGGAGGRGGAPPVWQVGGHAQGAMAACLPLACWCAAMQRPQLVVTRNLPLAAAAVEEACLAAAAAALH